MARPRTQTAYVAIIRDGVTYRTAVRCAPAAVLGFDLVLHRSLLRGSDGSVTEGDGWSISDRRTGMRVAGGYSCATQSDALYAFGRIVARNGEDAIRRTMAKPPDVTTHPELGSVSEAV